MYDHKKEMIVITEFEMSDDKSSLFMVMHCSGNTSIVAGNRLFVNNTHQQSITLITLQLANWDTTRTLPAYNRYSSLNLFCFL